MIIFPSKKVVVRFHLNKPIKINMKPQILRKTILAGLMSAPLFIFAESYVTADNGDWDTLTTWTPNGTPGSADEVTFRGGYTVDLNHSASVSKINYTNIADADINTFNITGIGTVFDVANTFQIWYNTRLNLNVLDGATANLTEISWGSGGYSNITVRDAVLNTRFSQMKGSNVGDGSFLTITNTTGKTSKFVNTAGTEFKIEPGTDYKMTVDVNGSGSILDLNQQTLSLRAENGGAAKLIVRNGAKVINLGGFTLNNNMANTSNQIIIYGQGSAISVRESGAVTLAIGVDAAAATDSTTNITFGGKDEFGVFHAADASALTNNWEVRVYSSGSVTFNLGDSNFSTSMTTTASDAIFAGQFTKTFEGALNVDFANISLLTEGTYYVALISSAGESLLKGISGDKTLADWENILNVTGESSNVKFEQILLGGTNDNILFAQISVIPEPGTYAAIFGALALGLAAYRRRK